MNDSRELAKYRAFAAKRQHRRWLIIEPAPATPGWVRRDLDTVDRLLTPAPGGQSQPSSPPNQAAAQNARLVLEHAVRQSRRPDRIVPSAAGGISFYWFGADVRPGGAHRRYAWFECDNDGDMGVLCCDRDAGVSHNQDVTSADVERALRTIGEFVDEA